VALMGAGGPARGWYMDGWTRICRYCQTRRQTHTVASTPYSGSHTVSCTRTLTMTTHTTHTHHRASARHTVCRSMKIILWLPCWLLGRHVSVWSCVYRYRVPSTHCTLIQPHLVYTSAESRPPSPHTCIRHDDPHLPAAPHRLELAQESPYLSSRVTRSHPPRVGRGEVLYIYMSMPIHPAVKQDLPTRQAGPRCVSAHHISAAVTLRASNP
jgi:hypothetical protein